MNPFAGLPRSNLEALRRGFSSGALKYGAGKAALLAAGAPPDRAGELADFLTARNIGAEAAALMTEAILATRDHLEAGGGGQALVVTGPSAPDADKLRTGSRFLQTVEHARRELMLATYALHQGRTILEPVHRAMLRHPGLRVRVIINIPRRYGDSTLEEQLLARARAEFRGNWPWQPPPEVWWFPPSLDMDPALRASMHAKFVIADEERCFITSANFTGAARGKNIEVGVELHNPLESRALSRWFKAMMESGVLRRLV